MKKLRRQVYLDSDTDRRLSACAKRSGISEAELIRRGLDGLGEEVLADLSDDPDWQWLEAFWARLNATSLPPAPRNWTRDELYDERPKYLSRRH